MRAAPITVVEKRAHEEPMDAGARYFRFMNISDLFNQMVLRFRKRRLQVLQIPHAIPPCFAAAGDQRLSGP